MIDLDKVVFKSKNKRTFVKVPKNDTELIFTEDEIIYFSNDGKCKINKTTSCKKDFMLCDFDKKYTELYIKDEFSYGIREFTFKEDIGKIVYECNQLTNNYTGFNEKRKTINASDVTKILIPINYDILIVFDSLSHIKFIYSKEDGIIKGKNFKLTRTNIFGNTLIASKNNKIDIIHFSLTPVDNDKFEIKYSKKKLGNFSNNEERKGNKKPEKSGLLKIFNSSPKETAYIEIKSEISKDKKALSKPNREQRLKEYSNMPIPALQTNEIEKIPQFGQVLSEQAEMISLELSNFIEHKYDNKMGEGLQESIENISKEQTKISIFNKNKKTPSEILKDKKQLLDDLKEYLKIKAEDLQNGLEELQYIKKAIKVYIIKAKEYLDRLNECQVELNNEITTKQYNENDFRVFDDNLKKQLLTDKIASINNSIIQMLQQYQKVTMQTSTHATLLNQVQSARETTIQNLYIQLALNDGNQHENESIIFLNNLIILLNNMNEANQNNMLDNIERINQLSKNNQNLIMDEKDKLIMQQIIGETQFLSSDNVQPKTKEKSKKAK